MRFIENNQAEQQFISRGRSCNFTVSLNPQESCKENLASSGKEGSVIGSSALSPWSINVLPELVPHSSARGVFGVSILHSANSHSRAPLRPGHQTSTHGLSLNMVFDLWLCSCDMAGSCHFILSVLGCVTCRENNRDNKLQGWFVPSPTLYCFPPHEGNEIS